MEPRLKLEVVSCSPLLAVQRVTGQCVNSVQCAARVRSSGVVSSPQDDDKPTSSWQLTDSHVHSADQLPTRHHLLGLFDVRQPYNTRQLH